MKNHYSHQYLKCQILIGDFRKKGHLVDLTLIHNSFGNPVYKTPRRVLKYSLIKNLIESEIVQADCRIEEVIQYAGNLILANAEIALAYLQSIDKKSYAKAIRHPDSTDEYFTQYRDAINTAGFMTEDDYKDLPI